MAISLANTLGKVLIGLVILALVFLGPQHVLACGNYAASCAAEGLSGTTLTASCASKGGNSVTSSINLNTHIINSNGNLQCGSGGGDYSASCSNAGLSGGHTLTANCKNKAGSLIQTSVDLNGCIANIDGYLKWCF